MSELTTFFQQYHQAGITDRLAMAKTLLSGPVDPSLCFDLVQGLSEPLQRAGCAAELEVLLDELALRHPGAYSIDQPFYLNWRLENSLLLLPQTPIADASPGLGGAEDPREVSLYHRRLAAFAIDPGENLGGFLRFLDRLRYLGRIGDVAYALRHAWPTLTTRASEILIYGEESLADLRELAYYAIVDQQLSSPIPASSTLTRAEMLPFVDSKSPRGLGEILVEILADRYRRKEHPFRMTDFAAGMPASEYRRNLLSLTGEFAYRLHRRHNWPRSRADLMRGRMMHYFTFRERPAPALRPRLLPEIQSLEDYFGMNLVVDRPCAHRLAALGTALPRWIAYLYGRGLCEDWEALELLSPLRETAQLLAVELDHAIYDPQMRDDLVAASETVSLHELAETLTP